MNANSIPPKRHRHLPLVALAALLSLPGCAALGSAMSPYSEKFSCKNSDHGQCIHPDRAYEDAVAGKASRSDPKVTNDRSLLRDNPHGGRIRNGSSQSQATPYIGYRDSVYRELQGLLDAPVTPMLRPGRTVRTLILPYADRERPDRLYMPRYVYSIVEAPQWVVGDYLVNPVSPTARAQVLEQRQEKPAPDAPLDIPAPVEGDER